MLAPARELETSSHEIPVDGDNPRILIHSTILSIIYLRIQSVHDRFFSFPPIPVNPLTYPRPEEKS